MTNINRQIRSLSPDTAGGGATKEQLFVIKIGGNVIDDDIALIAFVNDFAKIPAKKILVHGGGKIATRIGDKLGITSKYIEGRRITDEHTIDLVTMVYGGLINKKIVSLLQSYDSNAIGLTGADANILPAHKRKVKEIDYGFVGDIEPKQIGGGLRLFVDNNMVPVIAPLTHDGKGQILNTNADTIASAISIALSAFYDVRLIYCFEKKGVLEDIKDEASVIGLITKDIYHELLGEKRLFEGIIPKIDNAFAAIDAGVKEVLIGHSEELIQNTGNEIKGTLIK
jgi:acetylglutamate kinase